MDVCLHCLGKKGTNSGRLYVSTHPHSHVSLFLSTTRRKVSSIDHLYTQATRERKRRGKRFRSSVMPLNSHSSSPPSMQFAFERTRGYAISLPGFLSNPVLVFLEKKNANDRPAPLLPLYRLQGEITKIKQLQTQRRARKKKKEKFDSEEAVLLVFHSNDSSRLGKGEVRFPLSDWR